MFAKLAYGLSAVILVGAAGLTAVGASSRAEARSTSFWAALSYLTVAAEQYDSLADLTQNADAVVIGRFTAAEPGRIFGEPPDDAAFYITAYLEVEETLYSRQGKIARSLTVEFVTHEQVLLDELIASYPQERAIYFLRNNSTTARMAGYGAEAQEAESGYWHVVTQEAAIRDFGGTARNVAVESDYLRELGGMPFGAAVTAIREAAAAAEARITVP